MHLHNQAQYETEIAQLVCLETQLVEKLTLNYKSTSFLCIRKRIAAAHAEHNFFTGS